MAADATIDLVTFAEYGQYIGAEDLAKLNQERIEALITSASKAFIPLAGGRTFVQAEDTFDFDGRNQSIQFVRFPPVAASPAPVVSYWNGTAWTVASVALYPREIDLTTGRFWFTSSLLARGTRWRIVYTGGYLVASVPWDVKEVVCQLVQRAEKRSAGGKEGVTAETINEQSVNLDLGKLETDKIHKVATSYVVVAR